MKTNQEVTRKVLVIMTSDNHFVCGLPFDSTIEYSENIKYADEFTSIEHAEKSLNTFNSKTRRSEMNAKIKSFTYKVDEKFLMDAKEIKEVVI